MAVVEGCVPGTGNTTQAVTSYTPVEILWGHRFQPVFYRGRDKDTKCVIDLQPFNGTVKELVTPGFSARQYDEEQRKGEDEVEEEEEEEEEVVEEEDVHSKLTDVDEEDEDSISRNYSN